MKLFEKIRAAFSSPTKPDPKSESIEIKRRKSIFELLPQNSIGMEIGVHLGQFSESILEQIHPKELHLVDPWK